MIPKIIHYCWVGGAPKPASVEYCIQSWRKFCPDYEIIEWNESNYDFTKNRYMSQAYEAKKWGFVPDYARLDIVYQHGGFYLDTDVELVSRLDNLLQLPAVAGFEHPEGEERFVNLGQGFGAEPGNTAVRKMLERYDRLEFRQADGTLNLCPSPHYTTEVLCALGLIREDREQELPGIHIFPSEYFCPKSFATGQMHRTAYTVSIHHFTASWMDDAIRKEIEHNRSRYERYGKRLGGLILQWESACEKYTPAERMKKGAGWILRGGKQKLIRTWEETQRELQLTKAVLHRPREQKQVEKPLLFDTALESQNTGDQIIMEHCRRYLGQVLGIKNLPAVSTHVFPDERAYAQIQQAGIKFVCGTNLLSGHMAHYGLWKLPQNLESYHDIVLMGVGFDSERTDFDRYSSRLLRCILSKHYIHSVRDSFSEQMLRRMGIPNVLNTGCPTMWGLTPEHCASIPTQMGRNVVCTITDYHRDPERDTSMLDQLLELYETVYFWPQGAEDNAYLDTLGRREQLNCLPEGLEAFDTMLRQPELDYVGTRLHAGIRALNAGHRSLIISIDNRAQAIAKETGLPILLRSQISEKLASKLCSPIQTMITLPTRQISLWISQFES